LLTSGSRNKKKEGEEKMELVAEFKEGEDNTEIYWLSKKPREIGIGLKAVIDFNCEDVELIEENEIGKQYKKIFIKFNELKYLQTIIKKRKKVKIF